MDFKNERLMMSKEEARNRAKELLNENQVDLIIKYMFLEQQVKKQQEVINKVINYINREKTKCYVDCGEYEAHEDIYLDEIEIDTLLKILKEVSE